MRSRSCCRVPGHSLGVWVDPGAAVSAFGPSCPKELLSLGLGAYCLFGILGPTLAGGVPIAAPVPALSSFSHLAAPVTCHLAFFRGLWCCGHNGCLGICLGAAWCGHSLYSISHTTSSVSYRHTSVRAKKHKHYLYFFFSLPVRPSGPVQLYLQSPYRHAT